VLIGATIMAKKSRDAFPYFLAPLIVAMRVPALALEAQRAGQLGSETTRAISEKIEAVLEGTLAAQLSMWASMMQFWPEVIAGKTPALVSGSAITKSLEAAARPTHKRLVANFQRLSRRK